MRPSKSCATPTSFGQDAADSTSLKEVAFPGGQPKPHEARNWAQWLESAIARAGITDVARKSIPASLFATMYNSEALLPPPKLPRDASFGDQCKHR